MTATDTINQPHASIKGDHGDSLDSILRAILAFDHQRLDAIASQLPSGSVNARLALGWRDLFSIHELDLLAERARELAVEAATLDLAGQVLAAQALCAMAYLCQNNLEQATSTARRASRMAAAEGIPSWGRLVNLVLARVRRHAGRPHLALWICTVLSRNMPEEFETWVQWELLLAGHFEVGRQCETWTEPARTLSQLLSLLREQQAGDVTVVANELHRQSGVWEGFRDETTNLLTLIDAHGGHSAMKNPWCHGEGRAPPCGLAGLSRHHPTASQAASTAYVKAIPQREGRRLLTLGLSLCTPEERTRVLAEESGHARTDTALSVLAMAGPVGLDLGTFFKSVYGFAYDPALHRAVLDTLLHRMRKRVPSDVKLSRTDEVFSLDCERPFLIPDPRCALETTDVVLMALAKSGTVSANDLASALLIPLRSVQAALAQLAEDGACDAARDGRRILYQISDTTFTASTTSRS